MRIAVVDDNEEILYLIRSYIMKELDQRLDHCDIYQKALGILSNLEDGVCYDVYFLDIVMPEMNGLELAKKIRRCQENAYIVFVTAYKEYALDSYDNEIRAYQYIMKDKMQEKIPEVLRAISHELEDKKENYYIIHNKLRYEKIDVNDIVYVYKKEKNSVFVTHQKEYKDRKSIRQTLKDLGRSDFLSVDAGRIVNIHHILRIEGDTIYLDNGTNLYASMENIRKVKKEIRNYWEKNL